MARTKRTTVKNSVKSDSAPALEQQSGMVGQSMSSASSKSSDKKPLKSGKRNAKRIDPSAPNSTAGATTPTSEVHVSLNPSCQPKPAAVSELSKPQDLPKTSVAVSDSLTPWREQIREALAKQRKLRIVGGATKTWYGPCATSSSTETRSSGLVGEVHDFHTRAYTGVVEYEPSELYIHAKAGTLLSEVNALLDQHQQMLAFEPPLFGPNATVGGMLACGISGPRRAYAAAIKDHVLGVTLLNGRAEILRFGAKVIKNVAGFDVPRLCVGSLGKLGAVMEVTLKVVPKPQAECSLVFAMSEQDAMQALHRWARESLPISASCYYAGRLSIRLSGLAEVIEQTHQKLGGLRIDHDAQFWQSLREQEHFFFAAEPSMSLWRLSLPSSAPAPEFRCKSLIEWGGAQRWLWTMENPEVVRTFARQMRGHATLFRNVPVGELAFSEVSAAQRALEERIRMVFDPDGVFDLDQGYRSNHR